MKVDRTTISPCVLPSKKTSSWPLDNVHAFFKTSVTKGRGAVGTWPIDGAARLPRDVAVGRPPPQFLYSIGKSIGKIRPLSGIDPVVVTALMCEIDTRWLLDPAVTAGISNSWRAFLVSGTDRFKKYHRYPASFSTRHIFWRLENMREILPPTAIITSWLRSLLS